MRTPVIQARQCLSEEAACVLDEAVAVACRRSHAQTTSLHAVSALLALPSSTLREACVRSRSSAHSPGLQLRALELSVGVALDKLSAAKSPGEPPIANSLMAAIKRSQASQKRQPEYFQLQQMNQTTSAVKVELKHFILSIMDDPIVNKVFGEAGFRSYDVKMAIAHPPVSLASNFLRSRPPPMFLCNLPDSGRNSGIPFPMGAVSAGGDVDGNCRKIGDTLMKTNKKNPLLIGVSARTALDSFKECLEKRRSGILPERIHGLSLFNLESELLEFVRQRGNEENMDLKLKKLRDLVKNCSGPGIVVNIGDLKGLNDDGTKNEAMECVVLELRNLLEAYRDKLWLIGAVGSFEKYSKFVVQFPSIEKDWDLHLLPITSSGPSVEGFRSKSSSVSSFVPLGGFFSTQSDTRVASSSLNPSFTRCQQCNQKYEQEVSAMSNCKSTVSVADQHASSLPSWMQMAELDTTKGVDVEKTKDTSSAETRGIEQKWNDICKRLHRSPQFLKLDALQDRSQVPCSLDDLPNDTSRRAPQFSKLDMFQARSQVPVAGFKESSSKSSFMSRRDGANASPFCTSNVAEKLPLIKQNIPTSHPTEPANENFLTKLPIENLTSRQLEIQSPSLPAHPFSKLDTPPNRNLPTLVATDLGLGTIYTLKSTCQLQDRLRQSSGCVSTEFGLSNSNPVEKKGNFDPKDFKSLWKALYEKVGWQDEAVYSISQTVSRCRAGNGKYRGSSSRGDIWLSLLGPDKVSKKKLAATLAETIFGSRESFISVDLSFGDGSSSSSADSMFDSRELKVNNARLRAKTVVDCVAEKLRKFPNLVVFLENIHKADLQAQRSLSQAILTGRFPDTYGREIGINGAIFVASSSIGRSLPGKEKPKFAEECILQAKRWQLKLSVGSGSDAPSNNGINVYVREAASRPVIGNKRKLADVLDLNIPAEEASENEDARADPVSEHAETWLEEFLGQVDENVVFRPFDFDALADKVLHRIGSSLERTIGSKISLEIEQRAMAQILAAGWLSEKRNGVEEWADKVLGRSFAEAQQKYNHLSPPLILVLESCEGLPMEEQVPGVILPARILLN